MKRHRLRPPSTAVRNSWGRALPSGFQGPIPATSSMCRTHRSASLPALDAPQPFRLNVPAVTYSDPFTIEVQFSWEPSVGAKSYRVVVAESPDLAEPIVSSIVVGPSTAIAVELPPEKTLYWKVEAVGWGGKVWNTDDAGMVTTPGFEKLAGVTFVSDMPWLKATAGASNTPHRDTNYSGKLVSIGSKIYRKAVWTHSFNDATPADVVLDIAGKNFATFAADVGLDAASLGGTVQFQVLVDGQLKAESPVLNPGRRPFVPG